MKAMKMNVDFKLETPEGTFNGKAGDYIITDNNGNQHGCTKEEYSKLHLDISKQWEQGSMEMKNLNQEEDVDFINNLYNKIKQK